jgi:hypothetical protein
MLWFLILLVVVIPGETLWCVGRRNEDFGLTVAGLVILCIALFLAGLCFCVPCVCSEYSWDDWWKMAFVMFLVMIIAGGGWIGCAAGYPGPNLLSP